MLCKLEVASCGRLRIVRFSCFLGWFGFGDCCLFFFCTHLVHRMGCGDYLINCSSDGLLLCNFFFCFTLQVLISCGAAVCLVIGKGEGKVGREE